MVRLPEPRFGRIGEEDGAVPVGLEVDGEVELERRVVEEFDARLGHHYRYPQPAHVLCRRAVGIGSLDAREA